MEDVTLSWPGSMTTEQAKKYLLTSGFVLLDKGNKMLCGKCMWWTGLLVIGKCMLDGSKLFGKTTTYITQCPEVVRCKKNRTVQK